MALSLRSHLSLVTFFSLLPLAAMVAVLSFDFGLSHRELKAESRLAALLGAEIAENFAPPEIFGSANTPTAKFPALNQISCLKLLTDRLSADLDAATAIYVAGQRLCFNRRDAGLDGAAIDAIAGKVQERFASSGRPDLVFLTPDPDLPDQGKIVVARELDASAGSFALFIAAPDRVGDLLRRGLAGSDMAAALADADGNIVAGPDWPHDSGASAISHTVPGTAFTLLLQPGAPDYWARGREVLALLAVFLVLAGVIAVAIRSIDRNVVRWVDYLRRIAEAHSRERFSLRFRRANEAPQEITALGLALNDMADNAAQQLSNLELAAADKAKLIHELHHRVKNNFQVIESLLNLQKRSLPGHQHDDIRFVEDHVLSMVIADRIAFTTQQGTFVPLDKLLSDVVTGLGRAIADLAAAVQLTAELDDAHLDLDRSIALSLYLAAILPQFIAKSSRFSPLRLHAAKQDDFLVFTVQGIAPPFDVPPVLIQRLATAYFAQLGVEGQPVWGVPDFSVSIPLTR